MRLLLSFCLLFVSAFALQLQPATRVATPLRVPAAPVCQFGQKPDTEPKGLTRDNEPEQFFATNMGAHYALPRLPVHHDLGDGRR